MFFIGIVEFLGYLLSSIVSPKVSRNKWVIISSLVVSILEIAALSFEIPENCTNFCWQKLG